MSIALDTIRMLTDSAAHLWQRLDQYAPLDNFPQRGTFSDWLAGAVPNLHLDIAEEQQLERDYRRLCSLVDQLAQLLRDEADVLAAVHARLAEQELSDQIGKGAN